MQHIRSIRKCVCIWLTDCYFCVGKSSTLRKTHSEHLECCDSDRLCGYRSETIHYGLLQYRFTQCETMTEARERYIPLRLAGTWHQRWTTYYTDDRCSMFRKQQARPFASMFGCTHWMQTLHYTLLDAADLGWSHDNDLYRTEPCDTHVLFSSWSSGHVRPMCLFIKEMWLHASWSAMHPIPFQPVGLHLLCTYQGFPRPGGEAYTGN